jgi:hypothetical protein
MCAAQVVTTEAALAAPNEAVLRALTLRVALLSVVKAVDGCHRAAAACWARRSPPDLGARRWCSLFRLSVARVHLTGRAVYGR